MCVMLDTKNDVKNEYIEVLDKSSGITVRLPREARIVKEALTTMAVQPVEKK